MLFAKYLTVLRLDSFRRLADLAVEYLEIECWLGDSLDDLDVDWVKSRDT